MRDAHRKVIAAWDAAADDLQSFGAEGDFARRYLLNPTLFALTGDIAGKRILDAGCGEGYLSRLLAKRGALVTGVEPAARLYALCAEYERPQRIGTLYHRPLSAYVNRLLDEGLALRRMVEPRLPDGVTLDGNDRDAHIPSFVALYAQRMAAP